MAMLDLNIGRAFLPMWSNRDKFILCESPRGCLKTCTILNLLMSRAAQWPGKRWYIWRSTRALLSTTVLPSFEEYVLPVWEGVPGMRLMNPAARPTQRSEYIFENGSVFIPLGMDDVLRGTSAEGAGGYLAEAIDVDSKDQALALVGMMRQPGVPFHQIIVDVNPGAPAHWTNQIAEPVPDGIRRVRTKADYNRLEAHNWEPAAGGWKRIIARIQDNRFYFNIDTWKPTPIGQSYLDGLGNLTGALRRRWLDGEWAASTGSVFTMWDRDIHVVPDFEPPPSWAQCTGWDPGMGHPTGIPWMCVAPDGGLFVFDEIWQNGKTIAEHAAEIHRRELANQRNTLRRFGDPQQFFSSTASGNCDQQARAAGLKHVPWTRTGRNSQGMTNGMAELLLNALNASRPVGVPYLMVCQRCKGTISNIESWEYAKKASGELRSGDDAYEDANNDLIDPIRGIISTGYLQREGKRRAAEAIG